MIKLEINNSNKEMAMMRLVEAYKSGVVERFGFSGDMTVYEMEEFYQEYSNKISTL